jgi:hypothetical protein
VAQADRERRQTAQRWSTFLRNHADTIVACDFFPVVTATFRQLYVFVMIEHGSRRLVHMNVTPQPMAPGRYNHCGKQLQVCRESKRADCSVLSLCRDEQIPGLI